MEKKIHYLIKGDRQNLKAVKNLLDDYSNSEILHVSCDYQDDKLLEGFCYFDDDNEFNSKKLNLKANYYLLKLLKDNKIKNCSVIN